MTQITTNNLTLGRGKLFFDSFGGAAPAATAYTGRRYLGNTPEFSLDISTTQLDHFNSDQGLKVKDQSVILQLDRKGSFTADQVTVDNMALFLIGNTNALAQPILTAVVQTVLLAKLDRYYQVGASPANPSGVRNLTTVTIATTAGTPIPLVLGTDYTIDLVHGLVYIIPTSVVVVDGVTGITITYTAAVAGHRDQVVTSAIAQVEGSLSFQAINPKGNNLDYHMPYVLLTPNGNLALKGDTWLSVPFNFEVLQLTPTTPHIFLDGQPYTP
jgi:hypothetical protein